MVAYSLHFVAAEEDDQDDEYEALSSLSSSTRDQVIVCLVQCIDYLDRNCLRSPVLRSLAPSLLAR